jgi:hypothetical protein
MGCRMGEHDTYCDGAVEVLMASQHRPFSSLRSSSIVDAVVRSCRAIVRVRAGPLAFRGIRVADETAGRIVPIRWTERATAVLRCVSKTSSGQPAAERTKASTCAANRSS